ncbi:MAG: hypothetical protein AUI84_10450 [Delftia sp. 13_1_40CM_3_66_6]|nr:MAG: hypothetical protein AUI84_10450 [Delftia sp. 13_1_40CM_3_66_6]
MKHQSEVGITLLVLQAAPAGKLLINFKRPWPIAVLLPLGIFFLGPFICFRQVEIRTSKRHLSQHIWIVVQRNNMSRINFSEPLKFQIHACIWLSIHQIQSVQKRWLPTVYLSVNQGGSSPQ